MEGGVDAATAIYAWFGGDPTGLDRYRHAVAIRFDEYLANRRYLYGLERRWDGPFWQRRRSRERVADRPDDAAQMTRLR